MFEAQNAQIPLTGEDLAADLGYFIRLHESQAPQTPDHSAAKWDQRADAWEGDPNSQERTKNDDRVRDAVQYLTERGVLTPESAVADIGCGPGRFAAAFGKIARSVTGFDISERMVHYGREIAREAGLNNVDFRVCDFQSLDIEKEGLARQFDLVYCSLTPAVHGNNGLEKMMSLSRGYCCYITHIYGENQLERRIMQEVFGRDWKTRWTGRWFYSQFNVLYLSGYYPEASYYRRHRAHRFRPGPQYVEHFLEYILGPADRSQENAARIAAWLAAHTEEDGMLEEVSDTWYGRILWDVREKTERTIYTRG